MVSTRPPTNTQTNTQTNTENTQYTQDIPNTEPRARTTKKKPEESTEELLRRLNQPRAHPQNTRKEAREQRRQFEQQEATTRAEQKQQAKKQQQQRERDEAREARRKQRADSQRWYRSAGDKPRESPKQDKSRAPKFRIRTPQEPTPSCEESWAKFEKRWAAFMLSLSEGKALTSKEVPWPKSSLVEHRMVEKHQQGRSQFLKLYRSLALSFHPDKFQQRIGQFIQDGAEAEAAGQKACEMFKTVSGIYDKLLEGGFTTP